MGCTWSGLHALSNAVGSGGEIFIKKRRFRIQKQIGEGGFAFVYLVQELTTDGGDQANGPSPSGDGLYAIKKVLVQSEEQAEMVRQEIEVSTLFNHPNVLRLLDSDIIPLKNDGTANKETLMNKEAYLLFPVYKEGTLQDHLTRMQNEKKSFPKITVLHIFQQICAGLKHMHTHDPPYAHNDMKPGNVLLSLPRNNPPRAVIMDFGSARPARRKIENRKQALTVQEWATQHCTAPYRAPELWDTPSECVLDERTDIWALGCTLYAIMYGMSPFEYALGEQGGSLHLAISNGVVKWPPGPNPPYPDYLHKFVTWMVNPTVESRPYIQDVCLHVDKLIEKEGKGLWPLKTES